MTSISLPPFHFIQTQEAWLNCLTKLQQELRLALDLESNSMYAYYERICLIQISTPDTDYIVDPLADLDLSGLGELVEDPAVEKILHAAEYDMILMKREHDWDLRNLFDTMWAARLMGYSRIGLANMLDELFDIKLDKKYQRANWGKRPLSHEQLIYAQRDTHYLFRLRDRLAREIEESGRETEAQETFRQQEQVRLPDVAFDPDAFWSMKGTNNLSPRARAILKSLTIYRNEQAKKRDMPLFKIMRDKTLMLLAQKAPSDLRQLGQIKGISRAQIKWHGNSMLKAINDGRNAPIPKRPRRSPKPPDEVLQRYDDLHQWRKARALQRGVESDVILSRDALWQIARINPQSLKELDTIDEVGTWRCQTYGQEILNLLKTA